MLGTSQVALVVKMLLPMQETWVRHPWVGRIPWSSKRQPTPVFLPGKFHGQRSLAGYSPWGCRKLDTTEQVSTHTYTILDSPPWPTPTTSCGSQSHKQSHPNILHMGPVTSDPGEDIIHRPATFCWCIFVDTWGLHVRRESKGVVKTVSHVWFFCDPGLSIRLLCPWDFPDKNPGMGCHFFLQGIFLTQGSNPHLLH